MAGKRRGRPRISDEATERFDVRLPQSVIDGLCALASQHGVSVSECVRAVLKSGATGKPIEYQETHREHRYIGGPPSKALRTRQVGHETRARKAGVEVQLVDLRDVFKKTGGRCGVCGEQIDFDALTIDHILPISKDGPHVFENLQTAHLACNSKKGNRVG